KISCYVTNLRIFIDEGYIKDNTTERDNKDKEQKDFFTELGRKIREDLDNNEPNFNKKIVENLFSKNLKYDESAALEDPDFIVKRNIANNKNSPNEITFSPFSIHNFNTDKIQEILSKQLPTTDTVNRLIENPYIQQWVQQGLVVNKTSKCEFCENEISQERLKLLRSHFNDEHKKFQEEIKGYKKNIEADIEPLRAEIFPRKQDFYEDLREQHEKQLEIYSDFKIQLISFLETLVLILEEKIQNPYNIIILEQELKIKNFPYSNVNIFRENFKETKDITKSFIDSHNNKVKDFEKNREIAIEAIKNHRINQNFNKKSELDNFIKNKNARIEKYTNCSIELQRNIEDQKSKRAFGLEHAAKTINHDLELFLGHDNIKLKVEKEGGKDSHFVVERNGKNAKTISEGEKNAVSLIYFLNSLESSDQDNTSDTIVVLDDPISSFDSENFYSAISFIYHRLEKCSQLFILTHNYFLFHRLNRLYNKSDKENKRALHLKNTVDNVILDKADKILTNYDSEYHYLFRMILEYNNKNKDIPLVNEYPQICHITRNF
ncbi:MAG: AAA family ATPase, partial [Pseudomonadota bacterium]